MAYDASPSWSGFNYQGKVALFYVLSMINSKSLSYDFNNYTVTLEKTEDFEIAESGRVISYHQVKAYQLPSYSKYSEALIGIMLELYKCKDAKGFLHTWKEVNPKQGKKDLVESICSDFSEIFHEYNNGPRVPGNSLIEKAASSEISIPKKASIIRLALPKKTESEIATILNDIGLGVDSSLSRFSLFEYPDGEKCCDLEDINIKVKNELAVAFNNRKIVATEKQLSNAFHFFLGQIDKHIIERHKKEGGKPISISFNFIIAILSRDFEDVSSEYLAYQFKNEFLEIFDEFMGDDECYSMPLDGNECNLHSVRNILSRLSAVELWGYFRSFCPHEYIESANNISNALNISKEGILFVLIKIFNVISHQRAIHDPARGRLTYKAKTRPPQHYLPTTILSQYTPAKIAKKILENPNMIEILYEVGTLIYDGDHVTQLSAVAQKHTTPPIDVDADPRARRDAILETIRLIPIDLAKAELDAN
ncbi:hypothetical protein N7D90_09705 [Pseudomonas fragi]|uniref:ABC-three component system protein n=1 Tax=Pseudomonas fragi TaxID=296 RepID=UPI0021BE8490|nr:ABC-three component system protein [Pseudomonas fragi]UXL40403.1 hypothetical protein N7D90_09705 [Pseudomonas fragi]